MSKDLTKAIMENIETVNGESYIKLQYISEELEYAEKDMLEEKRVVAIIYDDDCSTMFQTTATNQEIEVAIKHTKKLLDNEEIEEYMYFSTISRLLLPKLFEQFDAEEIRE